MADIDIYLQEILNARYGEDVRESIYNAISAINAESTSAETTSISAKDLASTSARKAEEIATTTPYIGSNGHWYCYSSANRSYYDTGIDASITVNISDITMLDPTAAPYVTNIGTSTDPIFRLFIPRGYKGDKGDSELSEFSGAGFHNSLYRGKYLGSYVTQAQWDQIRTGSFNDLYVGDYWKTPDDPYSPIYWRIAAFDYWYNTGDTRCNDHHIVIVPDEAISVGRMNPTATTVGGYVGSAMYSEGLIDTKTKIENVFGASHILPHREYFVNEVTNGAASNGNWYTSTVDLMNEVMVYGHSAFANSIRSKSLGYDTGIDKTQLRLFALDPTKTVGFDPEYVPNQDSDGPRSHYLFRSVVSSTSFAGSEIYGKASEFQADYYSGVRPAFALYSATAEEQFVEEGT